MAQELHGDHAAAKLLALQHFPQRPQQRRKRVLREIAAWDVAQRVRQHEPPRVVRRFQRSQQRSQQMRGLFFLAGGEHALADGLEGIGDAKRVLRRIFPVGIQAGLHIKLPKLHRLVQQRRHRGRHRALVRAVRALLAVFGAAVGQQLAHDLTGSAADVSVRVDQQLIQQRQQLFLVLLGEIGAVFAEKRQIGADAVQILFALGLFQQARERLLDADRPHEADGAGERPAAQRLKRLIRIHQRGVLLLGWQQLVRVKLRRNAIGRQKPFKIAELGIDRLIPPLLFRRHVGQLREDHLIRGRQRVDADAFAAVFADAAHAEVRVDQQQRFNRQILEFEIPRRVIRRDVAKLLHAVFAEPLPGIIIMKVGDARGVLAPAAEFSDVVAEGGGADQRQIDRDSGAACQNGRVQRQIVDADGVRGGVEAPQLARDAQQRQNVALMHGAQEGGIFLFHAALPKRLRRKLQKIGQRVRIACVPRKERLQHGQILRLLRRQRLRRMRLVREKIRAQAAAKRIQPRIRLRQLRPELRQRFPAERRVVPVQRQQRGTVPERLRERVIVLVSSVSHRRHRPFPSIRRSIGRRRCFCLYHSTVFSALPDFFRKKCRRGAHLRGTDFAPQAHPFLYQSVRYRFADILFPACRKRMERKEARAREKAPAGRQEPSVISAGCRARRGSRRADILQGTGRS